MSYPQIPELIEQAWKTKNLNFKLNTRPILRYIKEDWIKSKQYSHKYLIIASRRTGKSSWGLNILSEACLNNNNITCAFIAPTKTNLYTYLKDIYNDLFGDCPEELKPEYKIQQNEIYFPTTNSKILVRGSNNQSFNSLRGLKLFIAFVDEVRDIDEAKELIDSVLLPALFDSNGFLINSSTPSNTQDNYLWTLYQEAISKKTVWVSDIYACGYPEQRINDFAAEYPEGKESVEFKREYESKWLRDPKSSIIQSWSNKYIKEIKKDSYYQYYYKGICLDIGTKHDLTAALFYYYDYSLAKFVFLDEVIIKPKDFNTKVLADKINEKKKEHFGQYPVMVHISDQSDCLNDLNQRGLPFNTVGKSELHSMVNRFNIVTSQGSILIHPRMTFTISNLENAVWDTNREKFAHGNDLIYGEHHQDALASAIYGFLGMEYFINTNPIPATHMYNPSEQIIRSDVDPYLKLSKEAKEVAKIVEQPSIFGDDENMGYPELEDPSQNMLRSNRFKEMDDPNI